MQETFDDNKNRGFSIRAFTLLSTFSTVLAPLSIGAAILILIMLTQSFVDFEAYYWALGTSLLYGVWVTTKWLRMRDRFYVARATVHFREQQLTQEHKQQAELKELYLCLLGNKSPFLKNSKSRLERDLEKDDEDDKHRMTDEDDNGVDSTAMLNVADDSTTTLTQE